MEKRTVRIGGKGVELTEESRVAVAGGKVAVVSSLAVPGLPDRVWMLETEGSVTCCKDQATAAPFIKALRDGVAL